MRALFVGTLFVSAYLLFLVQPMVVRSILPLLGGGPGVWNTCMVFFQASLLAGYLYAHLLASRLGLRAQLACHAALLLGVAAFFLPIGLPTWTPVAEESAAKWALMLAAASVGAPFFMLSATGPLLQSWFTRTSHAAAANPYPLYSASNLGSLLALLGYPLFIEPHLTLSAQRGAWSWAYVGFAVLVIGCGAFSMARPSTRPQVEEKAAPITTRTRLHWIAYALVPSSLMLATTQHLTSNIAAVPLLWVIPLAIYLLSFVIAFSGRFGATAARWCNLALPALAVAVGVLVLRETVTPIGPIIGAHLALLGLGATLCHSRLFAERPSSARLTEFYLWIGLGGVLGGVLNAFVLPHLFTNITEYPLAVALTCFLRPRALPRKPLLKNWPGLALAAGVAAAFFLLGAQELRVLQWVVPAALCLAAYPLPSAFAVALAALLLLPLAEANLVRRQLHAERTFFGVHRVYAVEQGDSDWHELWDGRTLHGKQYWRPPLNFEPTTYYTKSGPIGDIMQLLSSRAEPFRRAAFVGLGAGTLAAYGRAGQEFVYFEIDPAVIRIAQDPALFTYLRHCKASVRIVPGDARIKLQAEREGSFDLLVLDAFSSDAIPVHLLTREAMELYLSKLQPDGGLLAIHVTNWYLDLVPVVANIVAELGLHAEVRSDTQLSDEDMLMGKYISVWIAVARTREELAPLGPRWFPLKTVPSLRTWTDDYSDLMSVFRW